MARVNLPTGVDLYYEWHGSATGTPVVFIRGTGAEGARWLPQVHGYQDRYRCLIFDNRGAGKSDAPDGPYSVPMLAADTIALLDRLGVDGAHISGLSLGGAIAMELAIAHPDRVATLQLHGTWAKTDGYASLYLGYLKRLLETGGLDLYYEGAILYLFPPQFFIEQPQIASAILKGMKAASSPYAGLLGQLEANLTHDVADRLGAIMAPTLVTVGELDMCLPPHYSIEIQHAIAGSELHIFPGGSHLVGVQDPEGFNKVTLAWLDRQVAAGHG